MTARAKVNGRNLVYVGWQEEKPTMEDIVGVNHPAELGEI